MGLQQRREGSDLIFVFGIPVEEALYLHLGRLVACVKATDADAASFQERKKSQVQPQASTQP